MSNQSATKKPTRANCYKRYIRQHHGLDIPGNYTGQERRDLIASLPLSVPSFKKAIKDICLNCVEGRSVQAVKSCQILDCPLHPVRHGYIIPVESNPCRNSSTYLHQWRLSKGTPLPL